MSHSLRRVIVLAVFALLLAMTVTSVASAAGTITVNNGVSCVTGTGQPDPYAAVYCAIEDAVADSVAGDTINVAAGTYTLPANVNLDDANVTLAGAGAATTHVQVSGTGERLSIVAAGVVIRDLDIVKTDKTGTQNIIWINASNVQIKNNTIHGQFVIGDGEVARAIVISAGHSGLLIEGNTFYALRQPAYVSGPTTGDVKNNLTYGTKGWVLENGDLTFTGNTWGTGAQANVYDIAILSAVSPAFYTDIVAMSAANNGAVIEDQRVSPAVLSVVYVDAATSYTTDLGGRYHPYSSITPAVARVVAGGTINVAPGTYNESPTLNKSLTLKSTGGRDVTTINLQTTPNYTGSMLISGQNVTVDGFTIVGYDAVGSGLASTNVYVQYPAANVLVKNNRIKIGQIGSGSTGDDGFGVITAYDTTNAIASLTVTDNIFTPVNAEGARAFYINPDVNQFTFKGNEITGKFINRAISEAKDNLIENNVITGVGAAGSRSAGIGVWGYIDPAVYGKATFRGNTISGVATAISVLSANNVTIEQNIISQVGVGVKVQEVYGAFDPSAIEIHQNKFNSADTYAVENLTTVTLDAENNWWGSSCPAPTLFYGPIDKDPWWTAPDGSTISTSGVFTIPAGATTTDQNAILNCAPAGSTVNYAGNPAAGGVVVNNNGVTINLNGATIGAGSPAFTINADDVTLMGPGTLSGTTASAGILVNSGADNFTLDGVEIKNWRDGVEVAGSHASLKLVNNWLHDNSEDGFQFNSGTALSGVVTIEGNLFKFNTLKGIQNDGTASIPAEYNSWGNIGGPAAGDGIGGPVDATPFAFAEVYTDAALVAKNVVENDNVTVNVQVAAAGMYAVQYKLTYDPTLLVVQSVAPGAFSGSCTTNTGTAGVITAHCWNLEPAADVAGDPVVVSAITFKAQPDGSHAGQDSWTTTLDLKHDEGLYAGARGGIKVWVDNAGFGDPSTTDRNIADTSDGTIEIAGAGQFTGYIDLQGRTNDSLAELKVYNQATISGGTLKATATSAGSGAYTTVYASGQQLAVGQTYYFQVDRALYLPTTIKTPPATSWADFKKLEDRPLHTLGTVVLLGGDATDDDLIDSLDAGCIGGHYGSAATICVTANSSSDVTGDGRVDILDLTLMGGNYNQNHSPWTE